METSHQNMSTGFLFGLGLLTLVAVIGFDLFLHAGLLSPFYIDPGEFLLSPETAFQLIPLGYLSFALLIVLLEWLMVRIDIKGFRGKLTGPWEGSEEGLPLEWHFEKLGASGFEAVDCFWRCDCDAIYGGIRQRT